MKIYDVINKRRTTRDAAEKAPTWNHNRNWSFIILWIYEEKEYAFLYVKRVVDKFDVGKYLNMPRSYEVTLSQKCTLMQCQDSLQC